MSCRTVTSDRPAAVPALRLLLSLAVLAVSLVAAPAASAEPRLPPPPIATWPQPDVCARDGFLADPDQRAACEVQRRCDALGGGARGAWKEWCAAVRDGRALRRCRDELYRGDHGAVCAAEHRALAKRCPRRPRMIEVGPRAWLCEQFHAVYEPQFGPAPPPPPADPPPASTTPVAPPPAEGEAPPPPREDGGGTGTDADEDEAQDGAGEGESVPDVFSELGARSPMCNRPSEIAPLARARCETSGSIAHAYPLSHYGLDVHVAADSEPIYKLPVEKLLANGLASIIQHVASLWWMLVVFLLKGVLLLLEWSFEIPLIADCRDSATPGACESAMPQVAAGMRDLHENVLGRGWLAAAMAAAGIWGMWHGMVRRRTAETFSGLAATIALMIAGIVIVYNPSATIGEVARISNDAALGVLSAPTAFERDRKAEGFAGAQAGLFDTLVKRPWCALQFGDVDYCMRPAGEGKPAVADVWLSFDSGSVDREALFMLTKGKKANTGWGAKAGDALKAFGHGLTGLGSDKSMRERWAERDRAAAVQERLKEVVGGGAMPQKVHLQEAAGTPQRVALLVLVGVAQLGAMCVLLWIALRLVGASVMAVILLLVMPLVLLAASLGESGRKACLSYALRVLAAVAARFLFAFVLMAVLFVSGLLASLAIGWFAVWLLQIAFWFGLLFQSRRLLAFAQLQPAGAGGGGGMGGGMGLMQLAYGYQGLRMMGSELMGAVSSPIRALRASSAVKEQAQRATVRDGVSSRLRTAARSTLLRGREADRQRAEGLLGKKAALQSKLDGVRRVRGDLEHAHASRPEGSPALRIGTLGAERDALRRRMAEHRRAMTASGRRIRGLDRERALLQRRQAGRARDGGTPGFEAIDKLAEIDAERNAQRATWLAAESAWQQDRVALADVDRELAEASAPGGYSAAIARDKDASSDAVQEIERAKLEERRLEAELHSPEMRWAEHVMTNEQDGREPSAAEIDRWIADRRLAVETDADPVGRAQLEAAGFTEDQYANASAAEQDAMRRRSVAAMDEFRRLAHIDSSDHVPVEAVRAEAREAQRNDPDRYGRDYARNAAAAREQRRLEREFRRRSR